MDSATIIGRALGRASAYFQIFVQTGAGPTVGVLVLGFSKSAIESVAKNHAIDSSNVDEVSENLFDCLEYID